MYVIHTGKINSAKNFIYIRLELRANLGAPCKLFLYLVSYSRVLQGPGFYDTREGTHPTLLRPKLFFDLNLTLTIFAKLSFDQNFNSTKLYFSTNKESRFDKRSKYRSRSKEFEVKRSKYRKGRTDAYPPPEIT